MRKIAIACQGGGSQTAFTAGVLKSFFENDLHRKRQIVSLSGTSGGAICAALAWYGLLKAAREDSTPIQNIIMGFWRDLTAQFPPEMSLEGSLAAWLRLVDKGLFPHFEYSPASAMIQGSLGFLSSLLPRVEFTNLKILLEEHIKFDELPELMRPDSPALLVGAADVLTGELKKFNSLKGEISIKAVLASAAVPSLFPAVEIDGHYYWDGLFSDNPPVQELMRPRSVGGERVPDEIWVIQINPTRCKKVPTTPAEIIDRRNQLIGNVSLMQNLELLELVNILLKEQAVSAEKLERYGFMKTDPIEVHRIEMSDDLQGCLDYVSKLIREPSHIRRLIKDGEKQGLAFLEEHGLAAATPEQRPQVPPAELATST